METSYDQSAHQHTGPAAAPPPGRVDEFRQEMASLQSSSPVDATERTWLIVGVALFVVGLLVILFGWFGASGTARVNEQIPYLISGGVLGLGLVIGGAALFVRYSLSRYLRFWLMRDLIEQRVQADRQVEATERVEELLRAALRPRQSTGQ